MTARLQGEERHAPHGEPSRAPVDTQTRRNFLAVPLIAVVGPTGSGKTELALRLAERFGGEIVNSDSLQVYRYLDIGTAKPDAAERARAHHHLLDVVNPDEPFSAGAYVRAALIVLADLERRRRVPILCGGTGLYFRALMQGLADVPEVPPAVRDAVAARLACRGSEALHAELGRADAASAARIHPRDGQRIARALAVAEATGRPLSAYQAEQPFRSGAKGVLSVGFAWERTELYRRLDKRVERMLKLGLVAEVEGILARGYSPDMKPLNAIGYLEAVAFLQGRLPREALAQAIQLRTRHYAKRQVTWFRRHPRVDWAAPEDYQAVAERVGEFLRRASEFRDWPAS